MLVFQNVNNMKVYKVKVPLLQAQLYSPGSSITLELSMGTYKYRYSQQGNNRSTPSIALTMCQALFKHFMSISSFKTPNNPIR